MKVYEAVFKEGETEGVYALSVVENPAMEDMWITLSEQPQKIELELADEKKRLLLGAALIPNKKIYRNIDGNEFYITFSEETIEKLAHNFFKEQNNNNSSLEHEVKLEGMSVVEGWIVEDTLKDKSANYGKQYPKGTFVTMMKVDNDEMWQKALNGEIKGFSIDALLGLQEINLNTNTNMNKEDLKSFGETLLSDIKALFNSNEEAQEPKQEVVAETATVEETEVEEPAFDLQKALDALKEEMGVEFKSMLKVELSKKDEVIETKSKEIETLKAKLNKQPEVEETVVTPVETKLNKIEIGSNRPLSIQDRVFEAFNNN
jgi:hypothetical protein